MYRYHGLEVIVCRSRCIQFYRWPFPTPQLITENDNPSCQVRPSTVKALCSSTHVAAQGALSYFRCRCWQLRTRSCFLVLEAGAGSFFPSARAVARFSKHDGWTSPTCPHDTRAAKSSLIMPLCHPSAALDHSIRMANTTCVIPACVRRHPSWRLVTQGSCYTGPLRFQPLDGRSERQIASCH